MNIGIVCYPSVGGSGIVATGLGVELARRGHQVHFISYDPPFALDAMQKGIFFHKVELSQHAVFKYPDYTLPLAVKLLAVNALHQLDLVHVHYAVPHATAALLAKDIARVEKIKFPHIITTLHGTDITLLARDASVMPAIKYAIESSCGVTAVSESLKRDTQSILQTPKPIEVIYNFYTPKKVTIDAIAIRRQLGIATDDFLAIHLSNLRPVKRIPDLLAILKKAQGHPRIKLLILAGGEVTFEVPTNVIVKMNVPDIENYINAADLGIYTSEEESFGMGMLETMSYGKPVLATNVGGIPEVMRHGETGYLFDVGETDAFADKLAQLAADAPLVEELGQNAQRRAQKVFCSEMIVNQYEVYYKKIINTKLC